MVREAHGYKYHWAVADYLQRAARHVASKVDVEQAYAVGKAAVEYALAGMNAVMPAIKRRSSRPYRWEIVPVPLAEVANVEKKVPREFVTADGFGITAACRRYLEPLIGGRGLPALSRRPAGLRAHQGRRGQTQAQDRLQAVRLQAPCRCGNGRMVYFAAILAGPITTTCASAKSLTIIRSPFS